MEEPSLNERRINSKEGLQNLGESEHAETFHLFCDLLGQPGMVRPLQNSLRSSWGLRAPMHKASGERDVKADSADIKGFGEFFVRSLMGENLLHLWEGSQQVLLPPVSGSD